MPAPHYWQKPAVLPFSFKRVHANWATDEFPVGEGKNRILWNASRPKIASKKTFLFQVKF